ncbi:MAG: Hint domain-containing protein [Paracoccaceae bacterium]
MPDAPHQTCRVFRADDVFVSQGVNLGDGLTGPDEVCPGDMYQLDPEARGVQLSLMRDGEVDRVAAESAVGQAGMPVRLESRYALMAPDGDKVELLILLAGRERLALPLSPMGARIDYTLLAVDDAPEAVHLADLICVSFGRGTAITLADGRQRPIETLAPGDRVLTRDHGPQPIRWIGRATLRAVGSFAPVIIPAGTMGNAGDLIVSQHHRMFLYRRRQPGIVTSELLVQARHLVDGDNVFLREGGFVDYLSLVFDRHEIIYAEGIPAESLMVNETTLRRLPPELASEVAARFPGLAQVQHFGTEAGRQVLDQIGADHLLRRPRGGR